MFRCNHEEILRLYESGMTTREVASIVGCSSKTVSALAIKHGKNRPKTTRLSILASRAKICPNISECFRDFLDGLVLSDGHLLKPSKFTPTSGYSQCSVELDWLLSIKKVFSDNGIESSVSMAKRNYRGGQRQQYILQTNRYDKMYEFYRRWYIDGKVVPRDLNLSDKSLLRNWIYGDGTNGRDFRFCTDSFSLDEVKYLQLELMRIGFRFRLVKMGKDKSGKEKHRLSLCKKNGLMDFFEYVGRVDVSCFDYKWPRRKEQCL